MDRSKFEDIVPANLSGLCIPKRAERLWPTLLRRKTSGETSEHSCRPMTASLRSVHCFQGSLSSGCPSVISPPGA